MGQNVTFYETIAKTGPCRADGCVSISFTRPTGGNPVRVLGYPLEEGESVTINQPPGDVDVTNYDVVFGSGEGDNLCHVLKIVPRPDSALRVRTN